MKAVPQLCPPHPLRKCGMEKRFDQLPSTITGHSSLDNLLLRPTKNKIEVPHMLDYPQTQRHANSAHSGYRKVHIMTWVW